VGPGAEGPGPRGWDGPGGLKSLGRGAGVNLGLRGWGWDPIPQALGGPRAGETQGWGALRALVGGPLPP